MTDRENLEFLVYLTLDDNNPLISTSRARELLNFKSIEDFRKWDNNYIKYGLKKYRDKYYKECLKGAGIKL